MRMHTIVAIATLAVAPVLAAGAESVSPPADPVVLTLGSHTLAVWPFTTNDFSTPTDPVNLAFLDADPRLVRQALFALDGDRSASGFPVAAFDCTWSDAMAYEQAAWAEPDGWTGSEVNLSCGPYSSRFHLRLFRQGTLTLGATHFDVQIPGTAEHEAIAWDFPRQFVAADVIRAGGSLVSTVPVWDTGGTFRAIRYPIYNGLPATLRAIMGLVPAPPQTADVPIPNAGVAGVFTLDLPFAPVQDRRHAEMTVVYDQVVPKPFCATGPLDFVYLQGPLRFDLTVHTNPSGRFSRTYAIAGELQVTPFDPIRGVPTGPTVLATVSEDHRALITDHYSETVEVLAQSLFGDVAQSKSYRFKIGHRDRYRLELDCGVAPAP